VSGYPKYLAETAHLENLWFRQVSCQERPALRSIQQSGDDYIVVDLHLCLETYVASLPDTLLESGKDTRCFAD